VGEKGALFSPGDNGTECRLLPRKEFEGRQPDWKTQPHQQSDADHKAEWAKAIREGKPELAWSNFAYAGVLTEAMLLGNVAVRVGKRIEYDAKSGTVTNVPEAAALVRRAYRKGW
jgi:hypothetical protein